MVHLRTSPHFPSSKASACSLIILPHRKGRVKDGRRLGIYKGYNSDKKQKYLPWET
jgi:hypothetical protein